MLRYDFISRNVKGINRRFVIAQICPEINQAGTKAGNTTNAPCTTGGAVYFRREFPVTCAGGLLAIV